jgi:hypothetical protein
MIIYLPYCQINQEHDCWFQAWHYKYIDYIYLPFCQTNQQQDCWFHTCHCKYIDYPFNISHPHRELVLFSIADKQIITQSWNGVSRPATKNSNKNWKERRPWRTNMYLSSSEASLEAGGTGQQAGSCGSRRVQKAASRAGPRACRRHAGSQQRRRANSRVGTYPAKGRVDRRLQCMVLCGAWKEMWLPD